METTVSLRITPTGAGLGAVVDGLDLADGVTPEVFERIESAFHEYGLLVFHDQRLTEAQHVAFSRLFGPLEIHVLKQYLENGFPEIHVLSNMVADGKPVGIADAGRIWHADYSYREVPARASLLYARQVPRGADGQPLGDTLFVNTDAACRALPPALRAAAEGRRALHNYAKYYEGKRREGSSRTALDEDQMRQVAAGTAQPVLRTHPHTGRKCIYASSGMTTGGMVDMPEAEGRALLEALFEHLYRPEFMYRHRWAPGDLVLWDNCSTQHCATGDYGADQARLMHRTTVRGIGPAT